ncbi:helix-turn-helix domain-containing protein [Serratia liquefaciens]|uniref:helix-turn-helix domain-containing protein n=1 Tax=Serratia liquefaciens TaxID=614 RepID=UPI003906AE25
MNVRSREEIGHRVRSRRNQVGMTMEEVATVMGVSRVSISLWERGESSISAENLMKLSDTLQCSPIWIMTGEESAYTQGCPSSPIDTEDKIILGMLKLLPSVEKDRIIEEIQNKVKFYNELYEELKQGRP